MGGLGGRDANVFRCCNRRQRIKLVMNAGQIPFDPRHLDTLVQHVKRIRFTVGGEIADRAAKSAHLAPAALVQYAREAFFQTIHHDSPTGRNRAHEVVKLFFNRREVLKNIGVVEFQIVQNRRARAVMHEFTAFIEKSRIVFIGFNDEGLVGTHRAQSRRHTKIQRHTTDQKPRLQTRVFQNPRQHGGGGGFAVRSGYRQHMATAQHVFRQPLRAAGVGQSGIQNRFHQRIFRRSIRQPCPRHHIANHKHIGRRRQLLKLFRAITFDQFDAQSAKLIAHRRINARIAPRDGMPRFPRQRRQSAHERAANS